MIELTYNIVTLDPEDKYHPLEYKLKMGEDIVVIDAGMAFTLDELQTYKDGDYNSSTTSLESLFKFQILGRVLKSTKEIISNISLKHDMSDPDLSYLAFCYVQEYLEELVEEITFEDGLFTKYEQWVDEKLSMIEDQKMERLTQIFLLKLHSNLLNYCTPESGSVNIPSYIDDDFRDNFYSFAKSENMGVINYADKLESYLKEFAKWFN